MIGIKPGVPACAMPARAAVTPPPAADAGVGRTAPTGAARSRSDATGIEAGRNDVARRDTGRNAPPRSDAGRAKAEPNIHVQRATEGTDATNTPASSDPAPLNGSTRRDAAATASDGAQPKTHDNFATVLAASGPVEVPPAAVARSSAAPADVPVTPDPVPSTLPDQLLALLSGNWAIPVVTSNPAMPAAGITLPPGASVGEAGSTAPTTGQLPATAVSTNLPPAASAWPAADADAAAAGHGGAAGAAPGELAKGALPALADATGNLLVASASEGLASADSFALPATAPVTPPVRAAAVLPTAPLALPADPDAGFDDGFGTRIAWMAEQRVGHAEIRLNPHNVGPIEVRVQLDGDRVSAEFHSAHAEVRQALEASLPRLREMLGQHGLQLGQADVGQRQPDRRGDPMLGHGHDPANEAELEPRMHPNATRNSRGLLDEYA